MQAVYFEGALGIISTGKIVRGRVGGYSHNLIRCTRTGRAFKDVANWQTYAQYESLKKRDRLMRGRNGSLHNSVRPQAAA